MKAAAKLVLMFGLLVTLFSFTSCVPSKPVTEEQVLPAERLIKQLEKNRRRIKTFDGTGVINIDSPEFGANANFEVMLKKPDSIKLSVYGPFGIDLAHALVTKRNFIFHDVIRNDVYMGQNKHGVIKKIFKVDLSFDDLMDAFAGAVNLTEKLMSEPDQYDFNDDTYFLTYRDSSNKKQSFYKINADDLALTKFELSLLNGDLIFEGDYSKFRMYNKVPIPYNTVIQNNGKNQKIEISYRTIHVNEKINELSIEIPRDAHIIRW